MRKYYRYCFYENCDHTAGMIVAKSVEEAKENLRKYYGDIIDFVEQTNNLTIEEVRFVGEVCEIYYGS